MIGALQLVRYLNSHNRYIVVHGVNLSLSIPHEVGSLRLRPDAGLRSVRAAGRRRHHRRRCGRQ